MKLTVKNLGPIAETTVDLSKDLIVLTGQNNTGKTYLTNLICGSLDSNSIAGEIINYLIDQKGFLISETSVKSSLELLLPIALQKKIYKNLKDYFPSNLELFPKFQISFQFNKKDFTNLHAAYTMSKKSNIMKPVSKLETPSGDYYTLERHIDKDNFLIISYIDKNKKGNPKTLRYVLESDLASVLSRFFKNVLFFSAERQGTTLFHRDLTIINNKIYEQLIKAKNIEEVRSFLAGRIGRFPIGTRKNIDFFQNLDVKSYNSSYKYLAEELENELLQGQIKVNDYGDIQYKPQQSNQALDIQLVSSSVKSLSGLVIYLRHQAQKGDTIIIDEPELNLHPDSQRKVARFLGRLVNEGFKVIISTHSDYIIKELNNMIMLSSANGQQADLLDRLGYHKNQLLKHSQVEAHLFTIANPKPKKIKIDKTGFSVDTIDEVIEQLDNDTEQIYYQLFERENIA